MRESEVILLPDVPASEDAFGPHKRIAKAIHELITREEGARAIALVGTWGGGKSTVINLLKQEADQYLAVFIFDAWAHESDPLRRTFLERLIGYLTDQRLLTNTQLWEER